MRLKGKYKKDEEIGNVYNEKEKRIKLTLSKR